ncbi:MAG: hypothetical protein PHG14_08680 [Desulfobacter postgatei]|uniref:hypothetical protein n=1 Tax=Desulfobacter postgatei TaxID=2293 RepID=UPI0023F15115|nr:hypothetical protein [Desulfobacter postgatei]MDD4273788.1 hypothetical protein [Desulfobacter postgatei]
MLSVLGQMDRALEEKRYLLLAATPIAERSLTIQGIRLVVDSSIVNQPEFSPWKTWTVL